MSTYVFAYRRSADYRPDATADWRAWFAGIGDQVVQLGNPVSESATVGNCGADTTISGFSLISADDLDAARALAKDCPALAAGGGVEIGEIVDVPA